MIWSEIDTADFSQEKEVIPAMDHFFFCINSITDIKNKLRAKACLEIIIYSKSSFRILLASGEDSQSPGQRDSSLLVSY